MCIRTEGQNSDTETQPDPNLQIEVELVGFKYVITWVKISVNHIVLYYKMLFKVLGNSNPPAVIQPAKSHHI